MGNGGSKETNGKRGFYQRLVRGSKFAPFFGHSPRNPTTGDVVKESKKIHRIHKILRIQEFREFLIGYEESVQGRSPPEQ